MAEKQVRFAVEIDGGSGPQIEQTDIQSISLNQSISSHHSFDLRISQGLSRNILAIRGKEWLGKKIAIRFAHEDNIRVSAGITTDRFVGFITRLGLSRRDGKAELIVSGHGPTHIMNDGAHTRSYTDKSVEEIVTEVISEFKGKMNCDVIIDPAKFTESLPYLVQYREQNFNFLNRIASRYGEWFYYDGLKLIYGADTEMTFIELDFNDNSLLNFDLTLQAQPGQGEIAAYDYITNKTTKKKNKETTPSSEIGQVAIDAAKKELFPAGGTVFVGNNETATGVEELIKRQEEIMYDEVLVASGSSRDPDLKIGSNIMVTDSERNEDFGSYTITALHHHINQGGDYVNSFTAYPIEVETPPLEAMPSASFCETQFAKVTDVNDDQAMGRVKVKFLWQEGTEEESPFLRVATPYPGKDKGFFIAPEVGDQMLIAFENNSPDHPYVLTGLYNGEEKPAYADSKNHFKGFKTAGGNEIKLDDKAKTITISAPDTIILSAGKKIILKTGGGGDTQIVIDADEGSTHLKGKEAIKTTTKELELAATVEIFTTTAELNLNADAEINLIAGTEINETAPEVNVTGTTATYLSGGGGEVNLSGGQVGLNS